MSDFAVVWARRCRVGSASTRLVLLELAYRADVFDLQCSASVIELADACELSRRTTTEALAHLEILGLIGRQRRHNEDGTRISDEYTMQISETARVPRKTRRPRGRYAADRARLARLVEGGVAR